MGKNPIKLIVLEALAANIGGNFSPLGSPQNMYIFLKYNVHILTFLSITALFSVIGVYWLIRTALKFEKQTIIGVVENVKVEKMGQITLYFFLFVLTVIFLIFHINLIWITIVIVFVTLERSRESFKHVDYALLIIFVGFFITFDNLSRMSIFLMLTHLGKNPFMVYIMAAFLSQVMSNVPSTIFLSKFTLLYKPLLLGANVGGAGTLIASLANLIAYRLYRNSYKKEKFFPYFNKMNWTLFGILFCVNGALLIVVVIR
ncbi:MAG: SLC13 family permease [Fusobacteria bacterium]|nr:SLC13 family permease [Fusobacteriota bacterium]